MSIEDAILDLTGDPGCEFYTLLVFAGTGDSVMFNAPVADHIVIRIQREFPELEVEAPNAYVLTWNELAPGWRNVDGERQYSSDWL